MNENIHYEYYYRKQIFYELTHQGGLPHLGTLFQMIVCLFCGLSVGCSK